MIIGLIGKMRSGKSTVKDILVSKYDYKSVAFGDMLKLTLSLIYNVPIQTFYSNEGKKKIVHKNMTARELMQKFGDAVRSIDWDSWNIPVENFIMSEPLKDHIVIDDVRFKSEANMIHKHGGILWKVIRDLVPLKYDEAKHISETEQDEIVPDYSLDNSSSIEDLEIKVDSLLKESFFGGFNEKERK